ncbi:MAG: phospholipase [Proteobacteria bacterium]|nr:phospholipase [Pseudomonadota bacterium]
MQPLDGPRAGPATGGSPRQLVILCHGYGADGYDLIDLASAWAPALPHAAFAAPSAPFPCEMAPMGRQWFGLADRSPERMEAGVRAAAALLDGFIDAELARHGLPASAYALMGFSQGAMTVLFAGLRRAAGPRAILAYSGSLIARATLPSEIACRPPVFIAHGEADEVVPASRSRDAAETLRACGVAVEAIFPPHLGHGIDDQGIAGGGALLARAFPPEGGGTQV